MPKSSSLINFSLYYKMDQCRIIWLIIAIFLFILFFWWVFQINNDDNYDQCGCLKTGNNSSVTMTVLPINSIHNNECLIKFAQIEHEIDTLCRSYIVERKCGCQEAKNTYERIEYLCQELGKCISRCYGQEVGEAYAKCKRECCNHLKSCLNLNNIAQQEKWEKEDVELANILTKHNRNLSKNLLEKVRREHCHELIKMIQASLDGNDTTFMLAYDALISKTYTFTEKVVTGTMST